MIITEISQQKKKDRYNLFVDGVFYSGVGAEAIVKNSLKVGLDITKEKLEEIILESEERSAFDKLISIVSRQMYTKHELKQKLMKYGYNLQAIENSIEKAESYGYVNDNLYAKLLVESKNNKSKMEIKAILFNKGVKNNIITEQLETVDDKQEKEVAIKLADKYMKNKEINQKSLNGLYGYLMRKGFDVDAVKNALKKYKFEEFEE